MSYSFGAKTPQNTTFGAQPQGSITFGTPVAQAAPQFGLGSSTPAQTSSSGFQLTSSTPQTNLFGAPASAATPLLNFNTTSTASAAKPMGYGTPVSASGFGFAAATCAPTGLTFGSTSVAAPSTGLSFGTVTSAPTGLTFGNAPISAANTGLNFGTVTSAPTGLTFGGAPAASAPNTGLSFGTVTTSAPTGLSFGATPGFGGTTSAATSLNFGGATTTATGFPLGAPASSAGLTFPTPATQSGGLFGSTPASTGLSFSTPASLSLGLPAAATTAPTLNFGSTTTTAPTLNFGSAPATTSTGLNFGFSAPSTTSTLFGLGGSTLKPTVTTAALTATPTSTTQPSLGLGGLATQQKPPTTTKTEIPPKDQPLPNEILQTVEGFKNFVKEQKSFSSDISMCSIKEFRTVEAEIDAVNKLLKEFEIELQKNRAVAQKLKYDAAKGLQNADIAQRTYNTPPGLQYDNVAPMKFFAELADGFEKKIQELKLQIENTDSFLRNIRRSSTLTSQDLAQGMRRLHETFVALAGRLQSVHNQVEVQKEEYLNFRKQLLNDNTNVFEKPNSHTEALNLALSGLNNTSPPKLQSGPTPFNNITSTSYALMENQSQPPAYPGTAPLTGGLGTSTQAPTFGTQTAPTGSLFGTSAFGQSFQFNSPTSSFQLQKPPIGNKRGKQ